MLLNSERPIADRIDVQLEITWWPLFRAGGKMLDDFHAMSDDDLIDRILRKEPFPKARVGRDSGGMTGWTFYGFFAGGGMARAGLENSIGGLGPHDGLGAGVVRGKIGVDGGLQIGDRAEDAAADALAGHLGEEVFDGVEPRGREMLWGDPKSRGRSTENPTKSLVVAAVEKLPAPKEKRGRAVKRPPGFFAGNARIAVLPAAGGTERGGFLKSTIAAGSHLLTDGFAGYRSQQADLGERLKHTPIVQDQSANAAEFFPIIHTLFSNLKAWLAGAHHGVSAKHLPRYLREWSYRFNRRNRHDGLDGHLIRRAVECATIT